MHNSSKTYQELIEENALLKQQIRKIEKSEARYKMLFTSAAEGILVAESQTKQLIYANPALCRMLGYTEEELLQLSVEDIHPKESLGHCACPVRCPGARRKHGGGAQYSVSMQRRFNILTLTSSQHQ